MSGPITEDDLHGFVDNQLDPDRRLLVQRHLDENPAAAERIAAYLAQRQALRAALASATGGAIPARLNPRVLREQRLWRRRMLWRSAAAVVFALGLGGGGGWVLRGMLAPDETDIATLVREAVANHVVYTADRRRPTELGEDQRDDLARWVSNRLNHKVAPPDLSDSGFRYIGGRLAATPEGPAGMFMYQNAAGIRLTVFVRPDANARNTPLAPVEGKPMGGAAWIDKGVGYSVVAPVPADELRRIAEQVKRVLGGPA
jgi:anti-sigma factor RsiW